MSQGLITFFKFTNLGFHQIGSEYNEPLEMGELLKDLYEWFQNRISLEDTLLWDDETPGYENRKKIYLKSLEKDPRTGDYMMVLWRAVGNGNGVYGIRANAKLDDQRLYDADDAAGKGEKIIWGEASYYWFSPEANRFASIKFPNSISDTMVMAKFLRDFVELHSNIRAKVTEEKEGQHGAYTSVHFPSQVEGVNRNLWFRVNTTRCTKLTTQADLAKIAKEITHFVKRDVISNRAPDNKDWDRFFCKLPFVSADVDRETRKIEVNIEARPTVDELKEIFQKYEDEYDEIDRGSWRNIGFRKDGVGGIFWLNKFVVKQVLLIDDNIKDGVEDSGHYTARRLLKAIEFKRDDFLAPFRGGEDNHFFEHEGEQELAAI